MQTNHTEETSKDDHELLADALNEAMDKLEAEDGGQDVDEAMAADESQDVLADDGLNDESDQKVLAQDSDEQGAGDIDQPADEEPEMVAPSSWTKSVSSKWADLPVEVRQEIHRRESDYHKGIAQYKQNLDALQGVTQVLQQNQDLFQSAGVSPDQGIAHLMHAHRVLTHGTQDQKRQALAIIARDSGVDLKDLQPAPPIDPHMQQLMAQNRQLQQFQQTTLQQQQSAVNSHIEAFAADPVNVHFAEVREDMATLLKSGMAQTLEDAYEKAVWARPDLRKSLIEDERTKAEKRAVESAQRQRAKTAAVGVKGSGPTSTGAVPDNASLEDVVAMAVDGLL